MAGAPYARNLLWVIFGRSRGAENRRRMIFALRETPLNAHQLAKELGLNYKAIQHHIGVLEKNNMITRMGDKYGATFFLSTLLEVNIEVFDEIAFKLQISKEKGLVSKKTPTSTATESIAMVVRGEIR